MTPLEFPPRSARLLLLNTELVLLTLSRGKRKLKKLKKLKKDFWAIEKSKMRPEREGNLLNQLNSNR
jgi:hypothetical protein